MVMIGSGIYWLKKTFSSTGNWETTWSQTKNKPGGKVGALKSFCTIICIYTCVTVTSAQILFRAKKSSAGGSPVRTAIVIQDDSLPAAPPPQIRILKRPSNNGTAGKAATSSRPSQHTKTLAQREAEYAEARRRILGSASSDDTPQDNPGPDRWDGGRKINTFNKHQQLGHYIIRGHWSFRTWELLCEHSVIKVPLGSTLLILLA